MGELSDSMKKEIADKICSLIAKHKQCGISDGTRIICRSCRHVRPLVGAIHYGRYRLCNDCALHYELARAEGKIKSIEDFISE